VGLWQEDAAAGAGGDDTRMLDGGGDASAAGGFAHETHLRPGAGIHLLQHPGRLPAGLVDALADEDGAAGSALSWSRPSTRTFAPNHSGRTSGTASRSATWQRSSTDTSVSCLRLRIVVPRG
jgi:hypothetical protein